MAKGKRGDFHFFFSPQHGQGSDAPWLYATREPDVTKSLEFHEHSNVPGSILHLSTNDRVLTWNPITAELHERFDEGSWKRLTKLNDPKFYGMLPWIDANDRIWICACTGKQIECRWFDLRQWHSLTIRLDQALPTDTVCSCLINTEGRLEIFVGRLGVDSQLAMVETVLPLPIGN